MITADLVTLWDLNIILKSFSVACFIRNENYQTILLLYSWNITKHMLIKTFYHFYCTLATASLPLLNNTGTT